MTHLPTGMVVECQNERSQFQNKDKALEILRSRLLAQKQKQQQDAINASRQGQVGTGDRSEKIRTYNFPQDRCTDHRIGLTVQQSFQDHGRQSGRADRRTGHPRTGRKSCKSSTSRAEMWL